MELPIKKIRSGNLSLAIWKNEKEVDGSIVNFKTSTLSRSWLDKEKNIWRTETIRLRRNDLQRAILLLQKAQELLLLREEGKDEKE